MTNETDTSRVAAWLAVESIREPRVPLLTASEARAAAVLLRVLYGDDDAGYLARELAGRLTRRLPAEG